jgi:hypothetical protein
MTRFETYYSACIYTRLMNFIFIFIILYITISIVLVPASLQSFFVPHCRTEEGSLAMFCDQFVALSKDVGVQHQEFAEDVFHIISDK